MINDITLPVPGKIQRVPYDERRIVRDLCDGGCAYSAAMRCLFPRQDVSDERLAADYARIHLIEGTSELLEFEAVNRDAMVKKTSKSGEFKKAFEDAKAAAMRLAAVEVAGVKLGSLSGLPRSKASARLGGVDFEAPACFKAPDGRLLVVVFTTRLDDVVDAAGVTHRWHDRLRGEALLGMEANGVTSCILVGIKCDDCPAVRAVEIDDSYCAEADDTLCTFARSCSGTQHKACRNGSCRECAEAMLMVPVEKP